MMNEEEFNSYRLQKIEEFSLLADICTNEFETAKNKLLEAKKELAYWREMNYPKYLVEGNFKN